MQIGLSLVPLLSAGFLSFVPFLCIALMRQRRRDWAVFAGYLIAVIAVVVLVSAGQADRALGTAGGGLILILMGLGTAHSLVALRPGAVAAPAVTGQPSQQAILQTAKARMHERAEARKLAADNPALARDLKIGRPDLPGGYDDGGLVDVNHVPAGALVACLSLTPPQAEAVVAARGQLGRFGSVEEMSTYANLPPACLDNVGDLIIFG